MTGPEHYQAAEEILKTSAECGWHDNEARQSINEAKVHATLALAAATALNQIALPTRDWQAWYAAAATRPREEVAGGPR